MIVCNTFKGGSASAFIVVRRDECVTVLFGWVDVHWGVRVCVCACVK